MMARIVATASAMLLGLASAVPVPLDEVSSLVQQAAQLHDMKPYMRPKEVCQDREKVAWESAMKVHKEKMAMKAQARSLEEAAAFNETMTRLGKSVAQFMTPLATLYKGNTKLLAKAVKPSLAEFVKFFAMNFAKPGKPYANHPHTVDVAAMARGVLDNIKNSAAEEQQIVSHALNEFSNVVDSRAKAEFPELAAELPLMSMVPPTWEGIAAFIPVFISQKAVPFLICEAFPSVSKILPVFMQMPKLDDAPKFHDWFQNTVMPGLPEPCQQAESLIEVAVGTKEKFVQQGPQSLPQQLAVFNETMYKCAQAIVPTEQEAVADAVAKRGTEGQEDEGGELPTSPSCIFCAPLRDIFGGMMDDKPDKPDKSDEEPKRKCLLCEEYYTQKRHEATTHCTAIMFTCVGQGLNDQCLRDLVPCMDSLSQHFKDQDACENKAGHEAWLATIDQLRKALAAGTIEPEGIERFADDVSRAFMQTTPAA